MKILDVIAVIREQIPDTYYANTFPTTAPDDCAIVTIYGGSAPTGTLRKPTVQVLIRTKHPAIGEQRALALYEAFHLNRGFLIGPDTVILCSAQQSSPLYAGTDENGRSFYSVNFSILLEVA
ncbi:minor capsid protein [Heliophilum fasciatum]|uniref:Minor capsid protein n=1 Tax=Heliophilum fasciatum TaxID=35700 RepID=A0A4R2RPZ6_9FIRM|nr:minor capsid protein [Heliophilum fasciatum]MCW2279107.1 hypothetical protein [Heliophilum fasciatum]TCP61265.1 hypothetical protein EDD73_12918 [Heliophilum fasciatum]